MTRLEGLPMGYRPSPRCLRMVVWQSALGMAGLLVWTLLALPVAAQTVTVVGTRHLTGLQPSATAEQLAHTVATLATFEPTQVCVERMSGERIEALLADPARHGFTFQPERHGRALAPTLVPVGIEMQLTLERRPADARDEANRLLDGWETLDTAGRARIIGLQLAGFEFHSAVLNWSWLEEAEQTEASGHLTDNAVQALDEALVSANEVYSLGVPLARQAGLHTLCTADSQEDESAGMLAALRHGGEAVLNDPEVQARFAALSERWEAAWRPDSGATALTSMLEFFNSDGYATLDRRLQWETLREHDSDGAFHRRLMYWHARTDEMTAELFRALAQSPEERVLFLVGAAHRPFKEAALRSQPWIMVQPASELLNDAALHAALEPFEDDAHGDLLSVLVLQDGRRVVERFYNGADYQTLHDVRSAGKSVTSLLFGIAHDQGLVDLDDAVEKHWPEAAGSAVGSVRLEDLLTMRTGLAADAEDSSTPGHEDHLDASDDPLRFPLSVPVLDAPGATYRYNSLAAYVTGVVIDRATGRGLEGFAREALFAPLGIERWDWQEDRSGQTKGQGNLFLTASGFARIGAMVLGRGTFDGRQVVSPGWIEASLKPRVDISAVDPFAIGYGYYWYHQTYPVRGGSVDVFFASGNGGNKIYVIPALDMTVAIMSKAYGQGRGQRRSEAILKAVLATQTLEGTGSGGPHTQ